MDLELDLSEFCCFNKDCPDYGKKGKGNIRVKERYRSKNRALLRCNTCTHCFSETRCTSLSAGIYKNSIISSDSVYVNYMLMKDCRKNNQIGTS